MTSPAFAIYSNTAKTIDSAVSFASAIVPTAALASDAGIVAGMIASSAITSAKIAAGAVVNAALGSAAVWASNADVAGSNGNWVFGTNVAQCAADPSTNNALARKLYVDTQVALAVAGIRPKTAVEATLSTDLNAAAAYTQSGSGASSILTANANGVFPSVDDQSITANASLTIATNRVLLIGETSTNAKYNGVWCLIQQGGVSTPYILQRPADFDSADHASGSYTLTMQGASLQGIGYVCNSGDVIDTDALGFVAFAGAATVTEGNGITVSGSTISIVPSDTSLASSGRNLSVNLATSSGLAVSSGLKVSLAASDAGGLAVDGGGHVAVQCNDGSLSTATSLGLVLGNLATLTTTTNTANQAIVPPGPLASANTCAQITFELSGYDTSGTFVGTAGVYRGTIGFKFDGTTAAQVGATAFAVALFDATFPPGAAPLVFTGSSDSSGNVSLGVSPGTTDTIKWKVRLWLTPSQ